MFSSCPSDQPCVHPSGLCPLHGRPNLRSSSYMIWLFHRRAPASRTEVSLLQDRVCWTLCRLRYDRWPATDSLGDIW